MKSEIFQLGEVTVETSTRILTLKDGEAVKLRNKSKEVLACLLENPNTTVTKADLLAKVWSDVTVSDESLVQCIADIRRVIGEDARHIIETVPREGYRLNVQTPPVESLSSKRPIFAISVAVFAFIFMVTWLFWPEGAAMTGQQSTNETVVTTAPTPDTQNTEAYLEVLKGRVSANLFSLSESLVAERHFRRAIDLDPNYARAYAELGTLLAVRFENDWTVLQEADKEKSLY